MRGQWAGLSGAGGAVGAAHLISYPNKRNKLLTGVVIRAAEEEEEFTQLAGNTHGLTDSPPGELQVLLSSLNDTLSTFRV